MHGLYRRNLFELIIQNPFIHFLCQLWALNGGNIIGTSCDTSDNRLRSLDSIEFDKPTLLVLGEMEILLILNYRV